MSLSLAASLAPAAAAPVAPSQVTPESLAPKLDLSTTAPDLPKAAPRAAPAGAEALKFRLRRVEIHGAFPELAEAGAALAKPLEGRQASVAQLFALAAQIEALYAESGYPLVRVNIPPQQLRDGGDARIDVVDGFVEQLSLDAVPERARAVVAARIEKIVNRRHLKYAELERAVLVAGDAPGLRLRSALARGKSPGGVLLVLEADQRLVTASVATDNNLPASLGTFALNARLALNNAFGLGEQSYLSLASGYAMGLHGFPMGPLRTLGAGAVIPIGTEGFTLNPEITQSLTRPNPEGALPTRGEFDRFALRGSLPLERRHDSNLSITAAIEAVNQEQFALLDNSALSHDRYVAVRASANWQGAAFWGAPLQADAQLSQGLAGHAPDAASWRPSRQFADAHFTKLTAGAHLTQPVGEIRLDLSARGQYSFNKPLFASEQFSLDGADAVSAFSQGAFSVDAGEVARLEASRAFAMPFAPGAWTFAPYLFAAQGSGAIYRPTAQEAARVFAAAFGLGARFAFDLPDGYTGAVLGLELSQGRSNAARQRLSNRAALSLSLHF